MNRIVFPAIVAMTLAPVLGTLTASAQGFAAILEKLEQLERRLNSVEAGQKREIQRLKTQISQIRVDRGDPDVGASIAGLQAEVRRLAQDVEQVKQTEAERSGKVQLATGLVADLRALIEEFRNATVEKSPAEAPAAAEPPHERAEAVPPAAPAVSRKPGQIAPGLTPGGSVRVRSETKDDFNFNNSLQDYLLTQVRLNLKWEPTAWFAAFVEGQDARVIGEDMDVAPPINRDAVPNIFADSFDLHQAYLDFKFSAGNIPTRFRVGRQKFNLGAERLVSSLEWVNTARVWDGLRITIGKSKERTVDILASRVVPVDPNGANRHSRTRSRMFNSYFHALYYADGLSLPGAKLEGYWMLRREGGVDDAVHTVGARLATTAGGWDADLELAGQFGDYGGVDHRGFAGHAGAGYAFQATKASRSRLGFAYNFATGDGDPNDGKHTTFDNQYPLNHAYYGYMDFFSLQNVHNAEATFTARLWEALGLRVAYQAFWLAREDTDAWYNAGAGVIRRAEGDVRSYVGGEADVTVKYGFQKVALEAGYSHFFPGGYIQDTGSSNDADFVYLMTKTKF